MRLRLKPLEEQVLVITGASSGIGRATARLAGEAGARVVLAARDGRALDDAAHACERAGGRAAAVVCDVADERDVGRLARLAVRAFGGVDTWVNNAGVTLYGLLEEVSVADLRRLMDVNFWGVVYGSRAAVPRLEARGGGALVNVGSVLAERAIPLQGMYSASKHAVLAFTDALRVELAQRGAPVSVSLVKPATIDTPIYDTARSYRPRLPRAIPPVYGPEVAARAILRCATRPTRDAYAGRAGKLLSESGWHAPRLTDRALARAMYTVTDGDAAPARPAGNLHAPFDHASERGQRGRFSGNAGSGGAGWGALAGVLGVGLAATVALTLKRGGTPQTGAEREP